MSDIVIPSNPGRVLSRTHVIDDYTILPSDEYVVVSVTGKTLTLPSAASVLAGQVFTIGVSANGSVSVTVSPAGSDTIGGVAGDLTLTTSTGQVAVISDGVSNWETVRAGS